MCYQLPTLVAQRLDARRLALDRADARPGCGPAAFRHRGGKPQLGERSGRERARPRRGQRRAHAAPLCLAGAPCQCSDDGMARPRGREPACHRRGPLRVAMGSRLPARICASRRGAAPPRQRAGDRAHGDRRRGDAQRHPRQALRARTARFRPRLRPAEPAACHAGEGTRRSASSWLPRQAQARERHRLLRVARCDREDRRDARARRLQRARLSCRHGSVRPRAPPGCLPAGRWRRDGGDGRLRHGHRQA